MAISPEIQDLVNRLTQELNLIEQQATQGLEISRQLLLNFPNNARLIGLTATLSNALFFVDNFRNRIQVTVATIESTQVSSDDIQAVGEELSEYLGRIIESKIIVNQAVDILNNLQ